MSDRRVVRDHSTFIVSTRHLAISITSPLTCNEYLHRPLAQGKIFFMQLSDSAFFFYKCLIKKLHFDIGAAVFFSLQKNDITQCIFKFFQNTYFPSRSFFILSYEYLDGY